MRLGVSTTILNSEDQTKSQGHQVRASDRSQTNVVDTRTSYQRPEGRSLPISPRVPVLGTDQVSLCVPVMELGPGTDLVSARLKLDNLSERLEQWHRANMTPANWLAAIKLRAAA